MPVLPYHMLEKETVLHFFLHDTPGGSRPSAVRVVQAKGTTHNTSLTPLGTVWVVDYPLTEGPHPKSTVVGNSRGMYVSAGREELMLVAYLDFGFTSGEFNGSSISVLSRNPVTQIEREFAVVGGRGKFRMARGFANLKCIFFNASNGDSIVKYEVVVRHY
ncbi:dirigent protein 4-like [Corylus avellana]|uniref:dirigent protein 4-like n=1 Tax=Corylus avellana TaxID=13451 RepID=UPI001E222FFE|nr:dirigent protein 4-like [Corylus avellana]